ncbi:MAG: hypothetical protein IJ705_09145, partial [Oscillospiraceae bacterium]|nr:hypothetical protein [Oscillospiraceae bacterium]
LTVLRELLASAAAELLRRNEDGGERFHSALIVGLGGALVRAMLRLLLLPAGAWVRFSAACRALWRLGISKRKLLQWRTAAQSESGKAGPVRHYRALWFAPLLGAAMVLFCPSVAGKTAGVLWLLTPLCAWLLSLPAAAPETPQAEERAWLHGCARDTWRFFDEFMTEEDHFLPPDNCQIQPPVGLAHRTSPTNIGLGLLSALAAADLRLAEPERCLKLIERCLDSVEALPKWRGHLFNWYHTQSLDPLPPRYVSTVDSCTLCSALVALAAGLEEYSRPDLAARARALAADMDFAPLYDPKRKLLRIGLDPASDAPGEGWYDLLSSEARLTAYLAVARGDVPRELWRRLSRAQVASGVYRGMASWTGTMFEYLMPELLLPLEKDSLLYETARFCLYVQQKRGRRLRRPWGVSESAFGALDPSMNYRYKAHGCAALALKEGMDEEYVVSPYSAFLALAVKPRAAVRNLRWMEGLGMRGDYGFWEAIDYSSSRLNAVSPAKLRCVMAHHQGMSLVACANALLDGVMVRRFLADGAMGAYVGLLREKVPVGAPVLRREAVSPRREKPAALDQGQWRASGEGTDFLHPRCCLLAGERYQMLCAETGLTRALWGAISPYVPPASPLDREKGIEFFLRVGNELRSLLPDTRGGDDFQWELSSGQVSLRTGRGALESEAVCSVSAGETGERREIRLVNTGAESVNAALYLRFRPLLAKYADYLSHPAFCGLGVSAQVRNGCLLLRRLARGGNRELWLCLAPSRPAEFDLAPGADSGRAAGPEPATEEERFLTDPLVTLRCALTLRPGERCDTVFALALGYDAEEVLASARRMLDDPSPALLAQTAASVIGMGPEDISAALALLPPLVFPTAPRRGRKREAL